MRQNEMSRNLNEVFDAYLQQAQTLFDNSMRLLNAACTILQIPEIYQHISEYYNQIRERVINIIQTLQPGFIIDVNDLTSRLNELAYISRIAGDVNRRAIPLQLAINELEQALPQRLIEHTPEILQYLTRDEQLSRLNSLSANLINAKISNDILINLCEEAQLKVIENMNSDRFEQLINDNLTLDRLKPDARAFTLTRQLIPEMEPDNTHTIML